MTKSENVSGVVNRGRGNTQQTVVKVNVGDRRRQPAKEAKPKLIPVPIPQPQPIYQFPSYNQGFYPLPNAPAYGGNPIDEVNRTTHTERMNNAFRDELNEVATLLRRAAKTTEDVRRVDKMVQTAMDQFTQTNQPTASTQTPGTASTQTDEVPSMSQFMQADEAMAQSSAGVAMPRAQSVDLEPPPQMPESQTTPGEDIVDETRQRFEEMVSDLQDITRTVTPARQAPQPTQPSQETPSSPTVQQAIPFSTPPAPVEIEEGSIRGEVQPLPTYQPSRTQKTVTQATSAPSSLPPPSIGTLRERFATIKPASEYPLNTDEAKKRRDEMIAMLRDMGLEINSKAGGSPSKGKSWYKNAYDRVKNTIKRRAAKQSKR